MHLVRPGSPLSTSVVGLCIAGFYVYKVYKIELEVRGNVWDVNRTHYINTHRSTFFIVLVLPPVRRPFEFAFQESAVCRVGLGLGDLF